jgi:hypothetical protein
MSMEVLEALACIAEIERKIDNLFRHGPVTERKRIDGAGSFACTSAARAASRPEPPIGLL